MIKLQRPLACILVENDCSSKALFIQQSMLYNKEYLKLFCILKKLSGTG